MDRPFRVYLITPHARATIVARLEGALRLAPPGAVAVQLRDPTLDARALAEVGRAALPVARAAGARLLINRSIEVAQAIGADGVQLPENGPEPSEVPSGLLVGCSRHDRAGLERAAHDGADFATLSPVGEVPAKGQPLGITGFAAAIEDLSPPLPVYALGGVGLAQVSPLRHAGAAGVAVIRAVFEAAEPAHALLSLCT